MTLWDCSAVTGPAHSRKPHSTLTNAGDLAVTGSSTYYANAPECEVDTSMRDDKDY